MHRLFRTPGPAGNLPVTKTETAPRSNHKIETEYFITRPSDVLSAAAMQSGDY